MVVLDPASTCSNCGRGLHAAPCDRCFPPPKAHRWATITATPWEPCIRPVCERNARVAKTADQAMNAGLVMGTVLGVLGGAAGVLLVQRLMLLWDLYA